MIQSWNKLCFNGGAYFEVSMSMPGNPRASGYWPGAWTMGNLGRAGFGATNDGMWREFVYTRPVRGQLAARSSQTDLLFAPSK